MGNRHGKKCRKIIHKDRFIFSNSLYSTHGYNFMWFVICYGLIFGLFYLLSGSRADYLIVTIVISAIISIFVIILSIVPVIVLASDLFKERISKGVILIVLAIIALVLCNFVSAILWFVSAISILGRKKLVAAADTTTIQKSKGNANQASHKDTCKKELDSQDMMEHPEVKNPTTKNLEGFNEEIHKDEATTKVVSDNTEPPIESKDHVSKKD